jgi:ubiquinol-cytochrome c reductase cytochrome c1 subunit
MHWPQFRFLGTFDSGSVRRGKYYLYLLLNKYIILVFFVDYLGFQVFSRSCANCHGMIGKKYDLLL